MRLAQLIYVKEGMEATFHAFEDQVLPLLARHEGRLLFRARLTAVQTEIGHPFELHVVEFPSEAHHQAFIADEDRQQLLALKEASVEDVLSL